MEILFGLIPCMLAIAQLLNETLPGAQAALSLMLEAGQQDPVTLL